MTTRIGLGHDIHRIEAAEGGELRLGGVTVETGRRFIAHSDGDVLIHAAVDAVLGALGQGDIGRLFPNDDKRWENADSTVFLEEAAQRMSGENMRLVNLDATILAEKPKLSPHVDTMAANLHRILGGQINIKAGTNEGCDAVGQGNAIAAHVVVLLTGD